jgi:hypothetical protein
LGPFDRSQTSTGHAVAALYAGDVEVPAAGLVGCNDVFIEPGFAAVDRAIEPYPVVPGPGDVYFSVWAESGYCAFRGVVIVETVAFKTG